MMKPLPRSIARDLAIALGLLGTAAALVFLTPDVLSRETALRVLGVLQGGFVVFYANEAPKALPPLARVRNPEVEQAKRRFAGWVITLGGVAYAIAWLQAPVKLAAPISAALLALSVLSAFAYCRALSRRGRSDATSVVLE